MTTEEMKAAYQKGIVGIKPIFYSELAGKVSQLMVVGLTKTEAVLRVGSMVGVSRSTVFRACRFVSQL